MVGKGDIKPLATGTTGAEGAKAVEPESPLESAHYLAGESKEKVLQSWDLKHSSMHSSLGEIFTENLICDRLQSKGIDLSDLYSALIQLRESISSGETLDFQYVAEGIAREVMFIVTHLQGKSESER